MTRIELDLGFKGNRAYIQGADMLDAAMSAWITSIPFCIEKLDFTMHRMSGKRLCLELRDDGVHIKETDVAVLRLTGQGETRCAALSELPCIPTSRTIDKEDGVFARCAIDTQGSTVQLSGASDISWAQTVVAMTKLLHLAVCPLPEDQQWIICRLTCRDWGACDTAVGGLQVRLDRMLGKKLTKSFVVRDGAIIADIYFAPRQIT